MKQVAKKVVHGFTRTGVGWRLLQEGMQRTHGAAAHHVWATLAAPPANFAADDRLVVTREGAHFEFNRSNYFQWARSLGLRDKVGQALRRLARGGAFWDVGANIGYYSVLMTRWVRTSTPVVAVEPGSTALQQLRRHIELNHASQVVVIPKAVSDQVGQAQLFMHGSGDVGKSSLRQDMGAHGETIEVTTLDEIWAAQARHAVGLIKVDVEGLEGEVLLGAQQMLSTHRPDLVVEVSPSFHTSDKLDRALAMLREAGYGWTKVDTLLGEGGDLTPIPEAGLGLSAQTDVVFRPLSR